MNTIPLVRCHGILPIIKFLKQVGTPIEPLMKQAKLPISALDHPQALISLYHAFDFVERAAQREGIEHLGILAGRQAQISDLGIFGKIISQSLTLYDLLHTISALLTTTYNSGAKAWITYQDDQVRLNHKFTNPAQIYNQQAQYFACLNHLKVIELLMGTVWQPTEIHFQTDQLHGLQNLELFCQTRVKFNQLNNAIAFDKSLLRLPLQHRVNDNLYHQQQDYEMLRSSAPATDFTRSLKQLVREYLREGALDINVASEAAGISIRSLQRRLSQEGLTYSRLIDQVRFDLAITWLQKSRLHLNDIAVQLGYTELANFTRAFKRWSGVSPSEFRVLERGNS